MQVAGTEVGVTEPQSTFSACYGSAFLMWHPMVYASLLADRIEKHGTRVWLVNTGWVGGPCGKGGNRIPLKYTRAIVDAIHSGELEGVQYGMLPDFTSCCHQQCIMPVMKQHPPLSAR